jgi:hypothetical protein
MSFISPALISRIYQALGRNKGCQAILLLRQHSFEQQPKMDTELLPLLVRIADQNLVTGDLTRAEEHYKLGLALFNSCFTESAVDALRCVSGLCTIYQQQHRSAELQQVVSQLPELTTKLQVSENVLKAAV